MNADPVSAALGAVAGLLLGVGVARRAPSPKTSAPIAIVASSRLAPDNRPDDAPFEAGEQVELTVGSAVVSGHYMPRTERRSVGGGFAFPPSASAGSDTPPGVFVPVSDGTTIRKKP